jgi:hypothetical protein
MRTFSNNKVSLKFELNGDKVDITFEMKLDPLQTHDIEIVVNLFCY